MRLAKLIDEIGDDAELLARSDTWLEEQHRSILSELETTKKELNTIELAQRIKRSLQQKNLVPCQYLVRDKDGNIRDVVIRILNLPDALAIMMKDNSDTHGQVNLASQLMVWNKDGYDIMTSNHLRPNQNYTQIQ